MFKEFGTGGYGGFGGRASGTPTPSAAPVTGITVVAGLNDTATANTAPFVTTSQAIPLDTAGWVLLIQCDSAQTIADATKLTVNIARPGNTTAGAPTTRTDTALGAKVLRRAWGNQASALPAGTNAFYVTLDNTIYASDTITSITLAAGFFTGQVSAIPIGPGLITNSSNLVYEKPIVRPVSPPWRRVTTSITVEFGAISEWAAFGQQVARVEARGKVAGVYGPWAASTVEARSGFTPSTGRLPSTIPAATFSVTVDVSSLADSASRTDSMIVYRAYSWTGDQLFDSETDCAALNPVGLPSNLGAPAGLPFIKDVAGNHTPIYVWVNRDGTAGGSAAVQTGTTDPGAAGSYASENAALVAVRAWNNSGVNRPTPHNTTSGAVVMFRDVAGGSLGNSNLAYWQRATLSGFSDGLVPPTLASASYFSTGNTTLDCRRRGVQDDGTTAATSKVTSGVWGIAGLTLDSTGLTGANHVVLNNSSSALTAAAAIGGYILVDVDIREVRNAGTTSCALMSTGYRWDVRVDLGGLGTNEGPSGQPSLAANSSHFSGLVTTVGSLYSAVSVGLWLPSVGVFGCWLRNIAVRPWQFGIQPPAEWSLVYNLRIDQNTPASTDAVLLADLPFRKGAGYCQVMVRRCGVPASPAFRFSSDGARNQLNNVVVQHPGADCGLNSDQDRFNGPYQDQGWLQVIKRATTKYGAFGSYNVKDEIFNAPELPSATTDGGWVATTSYYRGMILHDNNGTPASRVYYQAVADFVSGAVQATDLADTARWANAGTVHSTAYGSQPLRTGTWRFQHAVRNFGNVASKTANGDSSPSPGSWYGEAWGRGGSINATWANYFKSRTGGALGAFTAWGDYRPQSIAAGDANDSPLLARVPAGAAVTPFDLLGVARRNDGTGAAGPYERSA